MHKSINRLDDEKIVKIKILSRTKDKILIKLPIEFVKKMVQNNALDFFNDKTDLIDTDKLLSLLIQAFEYDLTGEIVYLETQKGDVIRIKIE